MYTAVAYRFLKYVSMPRFNSYRHAPAMLGKLFSAQEKKIIELGYFTIANTSVVGKT